MLGNFDNQLKKQAQIRESVMVAVLMVVMCYMFFAYFYTPKSKKQAELKTQIKEIVEKKSGIEKLIRALKLKHDQQKKEMKKQAIMAETLDPRIRMIKDQKDYGYRDINAFLSRITRDDFKARVNISSLKYDRPIVKKGYKSTAFYLMSTGRFIDVMEFIQKLENIPALISLDNINIQINKSDSNRVTLDLRGTFYQLGSENV